MTNSRPAIPLDPSRIPAALRALPRWVCWKYVEREGQQTKMPISPHGGGAAKVNDPATWASFDEALEAWRAHGYAGISFAFTDDDPFTGIDLDGCVDDGGRVVPSALEIIEEMNSYAEISPGGRGVKMFIAARKPDGARCRSKAIPGFTETEIYERDRFFTVSGRHLPGTPLTIEERQPELDSLCERLWPKDLTARPTAAPESPGFIGDDEVLLDRARSAKNGDRFRALWAGDTSAYAGDDSAADLALCSLLAFWTGRDAGRIDRLFRASGLYRKKWEGKRGDRTYGQITIDRAIESCQETYTPRASVAGGSGEHVSSAAANTDGLLVPLGERDPTTKRLVLCPKSTLPTAEAFIREFHHHPDGRTLHAYGGELMEWRDNRYVAIEEESLRNCLQPWLHAALRTAYSNRTNRLELVDFQSNPTTVNQTLETIRSQVYLPASTVSPSWTNGDRGHPPAIEILPCKSMNLHIPTGRVLAPTPALFTTNALDFDYDPDPEPPERWIKFLEQLFGDDLESSELLQEWFGYLLTSDTSQQKVMLIVGPRRSGKGTIGRILTRVVGAGNVVGPTTSSLGGPFGLQPLIGKSVALISDARFSGDNISTVIERVLCISGEDTMTIDRKYLGAVSMKLPTRFTFLTNELPRLNDASTALAGRFLVLRLTQSFYGNEDPTLTDQLTVELPGILHWAIEGWKRLNARGRFVQPTSSSEAIQDLEDLASPVGAFVRDRCVVGPGHRVVVDNLYAAWCMWCEQDGRSTPTRKQTFGRDLAAAVSGVQRRRGKDDVPFYEGISLRGGSL